jgi:OOP family OmpA-OmpF porin
MKKLVPLAILCCVLLAPAARAGKFYIGASYGETSLDVPSASASFKVDDNGYKGIAGFKLFRWLAIEGSYVDFGSFEETVEDVNLQAEASAITLSAVGILPITPRFELFAKAGATNWDSKSVFTEEGMEPVIGDESGTDYSYGFGLGWNFSQRLGLRGELEYFKFDSEDVRYGSLGLIIRF